MATPGFDKACSAEKAFHRCVWGRGGAKMAVLLSQDQYYCSRCFGSRTIMLSECSPMLRRQGGLSAAVRENEFTRSVAAPVFSLEAVPGCVCVLA